MERIHNLIESVSKAPALFGFLLGLIVRPARHSKKEQFFEYLGDNLPFTLMEGKKPR